MNRVFAAGRGFLWLILAGILVVIFLAVVPQLAYADTVTITYDARTVDRDGNDYAYGYEGGAVNRSSNVVDVDTGEDEGASPYAEAFPFYDYEFIGWYTTYNRSATPAYSGLVEPGRSIYPSEGSGGWESASYYAVFREVTDDERNMPRISYDARTVDRNGKDVRSSVGGSLSAETTSVSKITGIPTPSKATAATGYTFIGWYTDYDVVSTPAYASLVETNTLLTPVKPVDGWSNMVYYAVFEENDESETEEGVAGSDGTSSSGLAKTADDNPLSSLVVTGIASLVVAASMVGFRRRRNA